MPASQRFETDGWGDALNRFRSPALDPDPSRFIATYTVNMYAHIVYALTLHNQVYYYVKLSHIS